MTLITAEPRFFFSLTTYAALSRFITSRHSSPLISGPIFFWATPLEYRLPSISLIFPIESKRRCRDSTHCFHLCNTAMISPAVVCQPRLFHSRKTSSTEKLLLITKLYSNYSSLGTALSPGMGTGSRRGENESGMSATHLPGVTERTFG